MNEQQFRSELLNKGIEITEEMLNSFRRYYEFLIDYNKKVNLTAITDRNEVYLKHFFDSASLLFALKLPYGSTLCDVGGGAGFPGIPVKILRPDIRLTIIDSLGKRIVFLNEAVKWLNLTDMAAINIRAEEFALNKRESFDAVTARAVARLNILAELCVPLIKPGGIFAALKGPGVLDEAKEAQHAVKVLGCEYQETFSFNLPENGGERNIVIYIKKSKTDYKYPRNYSQIKNKPL